MKLALVPLAVVWFIGAFLLGMIAKEWYPHTLWPAVVWTVGIWIPLAIMFLLSAFALNARAEDRRMDALDKETSRLMDEGDYEGLMDLIERVKREGGYR